MLTCVAGINRKFVVELVPEHYGHGFDLIVLKQLSVRSISARNIIFVHEFLALIFKQIRNCNNLDVIEVGDRITVRTGDAAQPNDPYL